jgi:uncharacterized protein YbjT (DUF2867 family)
MKAIVIGATGLVGRHITESLLQNPSINEVVVFVRRQLPFSNPKLKVHIVDFEKMDWKNEIQGDVLFSALGTTIKVAGTKEAQYRIDHDYQFQVAEAASKNGVSSYVLISSVNADEKSRFFYLKMKCELEEKVRNLPFKSISILRPGPLKGHREKERLNEQVANGILDHLPSFLVTPGMRPVDGKKVAQVAVKEGLSGKSGVRIITPKMILDNA